MKNMAFLLLLTAWPAWFAHGASCEAASGQLQSVSKAIVREDVAKAEALLVHLEQSYPDCTEIVYDRALLMYLKGEAMEAQNAFLHYTNLAPEDTRPYAYLARIFLERGDYGRADAISVLALKKNPADPSSLAVRGQLLGMKGQTADGIQMLEHACVLDSNDAEANYQLAVLYKKENRRGDAVKYFERSLAIVPGNAGAWDYLGLSLEPLGQADRADEAYRRGEAVNQPGRHYDGFLDYNYGRFLAKRNLLKEAKDHLDHAAEAAPNVRAIWYERAKVNLALKNYQNARTDAEKAASLSDPGVILDLQTYTLLEEIYRKLGENQLADKYTGLVRATPVPVKDDR